MNQLFKTLLQHKAIVDLIAKMPTIKQLFFSVFGSLILGFLFLSFLSYNPDDPAWSHVSSGDITTNIGGRLGAWVADILRVFFGLGVWWFVIALCHELARLWWHYASLTWQLRFVAYSFLLLCVSTVLAQAGAVASPGRSLAMGGVLGFEIHQLLVGILGSAASAIFVIVLFLCVATPTFGIRWKKLLLSWLGWFVGEKAEKPQEEKPQPDDHSEQAPLFDIISPKRQSDTAHHDDIDDHAGSLESFLTDSGIRADIRKKHERLAKEEERRQERLAKKQAKEKAKEQERLAKEQEKLLKQQAKAQEKSAKDTDKTEEVDSPKKSGLTTLTPHFKNYQEKLFGKKSRTTQEEEAPAIKPDLFTDSPKSRAMSTLDYRLSLTPIPSLDLLDTPKAKSLIYTDKELTQLSELLEIKLKEFNIRASVVSAIVSPTITRFEVELAAGIQVSRVIKVADDLARSMSMTSLRVLPIIAGKPYIGIEVPNRDRQMVHLIELLDTDEFNDPDTGISIAIGVNINGQPIIADLAKAPHLLVAGTTGSGKSVVVNSFLMSMLLTRSPEELRLILIDPKQVELEPYADIPHLLTPVITDMTDATASLTWCVTEMERRYALMSKLRVRNIASFNQKVIEAEQRGEPLIDPLWRASEHVSDTPPKLKTLPFIVVVADEFADMLMQLGKTAEEPIVRLAQKARASGIHLILATQRPTANVVTGLIKSNIPSRVALKVNTAIDSRIIIEESGADSLLGHGDMLFLAPGKNSTERLQGAFVSDNEVNRVCDAWRERGVPDYIDLSSSYTFEGEGSGNTAVGGDDEYYEQAVAFVMETRKISTSAIQRKLSIGYNRAARIVDMMEANGIVSPMDNGGKRQLLI